MQRGRENDVASNCHDLIEISITGRPSCQWTTVRVFDPEQWRAECKRRQEENLYRSRQLFRLRNRA